MESEANLGGDAFTVGASIRSQRPSEGRIVARAKTPADVKARLFTRCLSEDAPTMTATNGEPGEALERSRVLSRIAALKDLRPISYSILCTGLFCSFAGGEGTMTRSAPGRER
jgi:hypothetical protein